MGALVLWVAKNILQKIFPKMDVQKAQSIVIVILITLIGLAVLWFGWVVVSWFKPKPKLDLDTADKINSKDRKVIQEEVKERVEDNADIIKTVDERNYLNEVNSVERNRKVDEKVAEITGKIEKVKEEKKRELTSDEVECILMGTC